MRHFDVVTQKYKQLQYMRESQAGFLHDFIIEKNIHDVLEIGFYHGKSTAYIAAILEDLDRGKILTLDKEAAKKHKPNINEVLNTLDLSHRVEPIFSKRSYTWELGKLIKSNPDLKFDLCYFDGGHTWDVTGFGFVLVDMLLRPGGWIIFDDLDWTIHNSLSRNPDRNSSYKQYSEEEKTTPGVRMVFETLVPHFKYTNLNEVDRFHWGIAQKPYN